MEKNYKNLIKWQFKLYHTIKKVDKRMKSLPKYVPVLGKGFAKIVCKIIKKDKNE